MANEKNKNKAPVKLAEMPEEGNKSSAVAFVAAVILILLIIFVGYFLLRYFKQQVTELPPVEIVTPVTPPQVDVPTVTPVTPPTTPTPVEPPKLEVKKPEVVTEEFYNWYTPYNQDCIF